MSKHYFLGQASRYTRSHRLTHTFAIGRKKDSRALREFLAKKYGSDVNHTALTKNGRSALAIALKSNLKEGSDIIINGFTCYAVIEAIKAAKMNPVFADIDKETLHFNAKTLEQTLSSHKNVKGIIIQNTLGNPVDIEAIEKVAKKHDLMIFEDMAHATGVFYKDGREVGTVGVATALSFGKEKSIDAITGGAVVLRNTNLPLVKAPTKTPKLAATFRARFYPLFGAIYRTLSYIKLEKIWMRFLLATKQVERSADNKLDLAERPAHFVAKMALKQLKFLPKNGQKPIRKFTFVRDRDELIKKLRENGYYFDGEWFETPIAPERFYKKSNFNEEECPVATEVAKTIINIPTQYSESALKPALKIIKEYEI